MLLSLNACYKQELALAIRVRTSMFRKRQCGLKITNNNIGCTVSSICKHFKFRQMVATCCNCSEGNLFESSALQALRQVQNLHQGDMVDTELAADEVTHNS
jgi:hypothetical protein